MRSPTLRWQPAPTVDLHRRAGRRAAGQAPRSDLALRRAGRRRSRAALAAAGRPAEAGHAAHARPGCRLDGEPDAAGQDRLPSRPGLACRACRRRPVRRARGQAVGPRDAWAGAARTARGR
jgi:hypothetical protein